MPLHHPIPPFAYSSNNVADMIDGNEDMYKPLAGSVRTGDHAIAIVDEAAVALARFDNEMRSYLDKSQRECAWLKPALIKTASTIAEVHDMIMRSEEPKSICRYLLRWFLAVQMYDKYGDASAYTLFLPPTTSLLAPNTQRFVERQMALIPSAHPKRERPIGNTKPTGVHGGHGGGHGGGGDGGQPQKKAKTTPHKAGNGFKKPATAKAKGHGAADDGGAGN
jgi:hypothetical protein